MRQKLFYLGLLLGLSLPISAQQLTLPSVFTRGMVLQQQDSVPIWGWGTSSEKVRIVAEWSSRDTVTTTVNNQGQWMTKLKTTRAGGPYWLKVMNGNATQTLTLQDVMLGEVWLCSGQSNMEFSVSWGLKDGDKEVSHADYANLRIFHMPKQGADTPQNDCKARWEVSSPASMKRTSSVAYFFGRKLSEVLKVPVGIIVAAWGGTPAEVWTPSESVLNDSVLAKCKLKDYAWWPKKPGVLYNQMIASVVPFRIAGCIWYQGESNQPNGASYGRLMKALITSWRQNFHQSFPFLLFQIAPWTYHSEHSGPALLREQQEWLTRHVADTKMVNVSDIVEDVKDIHPKDKRRVGERMTDMALSQVYHQQGFACDYPTLGSFVLSGKKAVITFKDYAQGISNRGKEIVGITVFTGDKWLKAKAKLSKNRLTVFSPDGNSIQAIRYCFDDDTIGTLQSADGLPVLPFRTDHFSE